MVSFACHDAYVCVYINTYLLVSVKLIWYAALIRGTIFMRIAKTYKSHVVFQYCCDLDISMVFIFG